MEAVLVFRLRIHRAVDTLTQGIRPFLVLTALCAALFLPGLSVLPPTDRDEARFMQATKQMLETEDVVNIRFQSEPRTKKPVGIHWLQYLSVKYVAQDSLDTVWAYRLPSSIAAWLSILLIFTFGRTMFGARAGLVAAGLTACTFIMAVEAHLAKTDAVLLLTVIIAQMTLFKFYCAPPGKPPPVRVAILFWAAVGAGLLIKGPVIVVVVGVAVLALSISDRKVIWLRGLQPEIGVPIAIAFVLPWMLALLADGQGSVIAASLSEDFLPKLFSSAEGHGAPPGTHLLISPITLWPASLILLPGLLLAWSHRDVPGVRYCLAWAGATWLMFELVPTKLPHYILPAVPALALAVAGASFKTDLTLPRWSKLLWTVTTLAILTGVLWATHLYDGAILPAAALTLALLLCTCLTWMKPTQFQALVPATAVLSFGLLVGAVIPRLDALALSPRLAALIKPYISPESPPVVLSRYQEPSAVFLLGTETWLSDSRNAAAHVAADPLALAVVADDQLLSIREMIEVTGGAMIVVDKITGYNYSKGRSESLSIIRSQSTAPAE